MANALGKLFGDIASAIREKTGDTATMKPAEFPEKIAAIEAGGGGGSLPAGSYWKQDRLPPAYVYTNEFFSFGNTVYVFIKPTSTSTTYDLYEYSNGEYNLIYSGVTVSSSQHLEYNGKIHSIGYNKYHYVFNGKVETKLKSLPGESLGRGQLNRFVWNGQLHAYAAGKLYVWDETTDTWTDTGLITGSETYNKGTCFVVNGTLYRYYSSRLYKYVDGTETEVKKFDLYYTIQGVHEATIYLTYAYNTLYAYNIENDTMQFIGIPPQNSVYYYLTPDGRLGVYGFSSSNYWVNMQRYEVTE